MNRFSSAAQNAARSIYGAPDDASRPRLVRAAEQAVPSAKARALNLKIATSVLGFTVLAALLTGCSADATDLKPTAAPAASSTPVAEAPVAETPVAAPVTGDNVDAIEAKEILKSGLGQRAYPMADGTYVVVTKDEPLPEAVHYDIEDKTNATLTPYRENSQDRDAAMAQAQDYVAKNTGKQVILAWHVYGFDDPSAEAKSEFWFIAGGPDSTAHYTAKADAQSAIDGWLAGKDDAATYTIVFAG